MDSQSLNPYLKFNFSLTHNTKPKHFSNPIKIISAYTIEEIGHCFSEIEDMITQGYYVAGFISYEAAPAFNPNLKVKANPKMPLLWFGVFDQPSTPRVFELSDFNISEWKSHISKKHYNKQIAKIQSFIQQGKTEQVNYTLKMKADFEGDPYTFSENLINAQAADYTAFLDTGRFKIASASPELFFKLQDGVLTTKPMAGTSRRGRWYEEDLAQAQWLKHSKKNKHENNIIVKAMKKELETIADKGHVQVIDQHAIEKYPTVYQMTTTLMTELSPNTQLFDIFQALFPCSSITGLPKKETMDVISEAEHEARDVYCGAIGYITPHQEAIFNVPIRTAVVDTKNNKAVYGVGGGITLDSTAKEEYEEVLTKTAILHTQQPDYQLLESLLLDDGQYFLFENHMKRLMESANYFNIDLNINEIKQALHSYADKLTRGIYKIRLLVNRNGSYTMEESRIAKIKDTQSISIAKTPIDKEDIFHYHKTTYRKIYDKHKQIDFFDVLLWNEKEEITEFLNGNVVIEMNEKLYTPPVSCGLLPGTFRNHLLSEGSVSERTITLDDLSSCDAVWFINSVRKWVPVHIH